MSTAKQMGVFVTYNEVYAAELGVRLPMIAEQPLPASLVENTSSWQPLPLAQKLGMPLMVCELDVLDRNGPSYYNEIVALLSVEPNAPSTNFCKPTSEANSSVFIARADGVDLYPTEVKALVDFIKQELPALVTFCRDTTDGEETEGEEEEGVLRAERLACPIGKVTPGKFAKFLLEKEEMESEMA